MTYTGPVLEDMDALDTTCMAILGDGIEYQPAGGAFAPLRAYVDYGEAERDLQTGKVIAQDITVEAMHADVPIRPSAVCRVQLGKRPGDTFRPVNVRNSEDGTHWRFELEKVSA